ncbi:MAG: DUF402 domain-containing protein [Clostridiales bacterium]|nr:DUF402 domain-containing protein [Clostridiales bacterium]
MKQKTILRREWKGIHSRLYAERRISAFGSEGIAGLLHMTSADDFSVSVGRRRVKITSNGYQWLQIALMGRQVWATVMFDKEGVISECYFDITDENRVEDGGRSGFSDLFLDVVIAPDDPDVYMLDADELEHACDTGEITRQQRAIAYAARKELLCFISEHKAEFFAWCAEIRNELSKQLEKAD